MKKGILIISPSFHPDTGGMATHLDDLSRYLISSDYRVFVATCQPIITEGKGKYFERSENLVIFRAPLLGWRLFNPTGRLRFFYETFLLFPPAFLILLSHYRSIDIIHTHGHVASVVAKVLKSIFRKRVFLSTHNSFIFNKKKLSHLVVRWALLSMDFILAVSKQSRDELIEIGLDPKKIAVYTHWVNQDRFKQMNKKWSKEEVGWSNQFVVLYVGRLEPSKGAGVLMDVAAKFNRGITFAFIGDGSMVGEISKRASSCENIVFVGEVENKRLPVYMNAADIFVMPTQGNEGFGRVIIEAFSCGLTVIGTKKGRIPQIINKNVGIIVEPPDVENISRAILELYNNRDRLRLLSENAVKYAKEKYSDKNAELIVKTAERFALV